MPHYETNGNKVNNKQRMEKVFSSYLQELSELKVAKLFLAVVPKVQTDELTVPVEGNVVVYRGLAEDITRVLWSTNRQGFNVKTQLYV